MMHKSWLVVSDDVMFDGCEPAFTFQSLANADDVDYSGKNIRVCQLCLHTHTDGPVIERFNIEIHKSEYGDFHTTVTRVVDTDGKTECVAATPFIPGVQLTKLCEGRGTEYVCYMIEHETKRAIISQLLPMIVTDINPTHKHHLISSSGIQAKYINEFGLTDAIRVILTHAHGADSITRTSI